MKNVEPLHEAVVPGAKKSTLVLVWFIALSLPTFGAFTHFESIGETVFIFVVMIAFLAVTTWFIAKIRPEVRLSLYLDYLELRVSRFGKMTEKNISTRFRWLSRTFFLKS